MAEPVMHKEPSSTLHAQTGGDVLHNVFRDLYGAVLPKFDIETKRNGETSNDFLARIRSINMERSKILSDLAGLKSFLSDASAAVASPSVHDPIDTNDPKPPCGWNDISDVVDCTVLEEVGLLTPKDFLPPSSIHHSYPAGRSNPRYVDDTQSSTERWATTQRLHPQAFNGTRREKKSGENESTLLFSDFQDTAFKARENPPIAKSTLRRTVDGPSVNRTPLSRSKCMKADHGTSVVTDLVKTKRLSGSFAAAVRPSSACDAPVRTTSARLQGTEVAAITFKAAPTEIVFETFEVGETVRATLKLTNVSPSARHVQVLPPTSQDEFFIIRKLAKTAGSLPTSSEPDARAPRGETSSATGNVAPGLSCLVEVQFTARHLGDMSTELTVVPEGGSEFTVPLRAARPRPTLGLPSTGVLDCGPCHVGRTGTQTGTELGATTPVVKTFACRNSGAKARFRLVVAADGPTTAAEIAVLPESFWNGAHTNNVGAASANTLQVGSFTISPAVMTLDHAGNIDLTVSYRATAVGSESAAICVVDDSCRCTPLTLSGQGEIPRLTVVSNSSSAKVLVEASLADTTTEVLFDPTYPGQPVEHRVTVANNSALDLPYSWVLEAYDATQRSAVDLSTPTAEGVVADVQAFSIHPSKGVFGMNSTETFTMRFTSPVPQRCAVRACMMLLDHGDEAVATPTKPPALDYSRCKPTSNTGEADGSGVSGTVSGRHTAAGVTVDLFAECIAFAVTLQPPVLDFNPLPISPDQPHTHTIVVENASAIATTIQWESADTRTNSASAATVAVVPATGTIAGGMSQQFDVVVRPHARGPFAATHVCSVPGGLRLPLAVHGVVGAVDIRIGTACVNFGTIRSGTTRRVTFPLESFSAMDVRWTCALRSVETQRASGVTGASLTLAARDGTLGPRAVDDITVTFHPTVDATGVLNEELVFCAHDGSTQSVRIVGESIAPRVCLDTCTVDFGVVYVGVPATRVVQLRNLTLLPAVYVTKGRVDPSGTIAFVDSQGGLLPRKHKDLALSFVGTAPCAYKDTVHVIVEGMQEPVCLEVCATVQDLSVSVVPSGIGGRGDVHAVDLPIGDVAINTCSAKHEIILTNNTGIEVEYLFSVLGFPAAGHTRDISDTLQPRDVVQESKGGAKIRIPAPPSTRTVSAPGFMRDRASSAEARHYTGRRRGSPRNVRGPAFLGAHNGGEPATPSTTVSIASRGAPSSDTMELAKENGNVAVPPSRSGSTGGDGPPDVSQRVRDVLLRSQQLLQNDKGFAVEISPKSACLAPFGEVRVSVCVTGDTWGTYKDIIRCVPRPRHKTAPTLSQGSADFSRGVLDVSIGARIVGCALKPHVVMTSSATPPIVRLPAVVCRTDAAPRDSGRVNHELDGTAETSKKIRFSNPSPFALTVTWECCFSDPNERKLVDFLCAFDADKQRFRPRVRAHEGAEYATQPFRIAALAQAVASPKARGSNELANICSIPGRQMRVNHGMVDVAFATSMVGDHTGFLRGVVNFADEAAVAASLGLSDSAVRAGVCVSRERTETESTALKILLQGSAVHPALAIATHTERLDFVCKWSQLPTKGAEKGEAKTIVVSNPTPATLACTMCIGPATTGAFHLDAVEVNGEMAAGADGDVVVLPPGASACIRVSLVLSPLLFPDASRLLVSKLGDDLAETTRVVTAAADIHIEFAGGQTQSIPLFATVHHPAVSVSHTQLDFGSVNEPSTQTVVISNSGLDAFVYLVKLSPGAFSCEQSTGTHVLDASTTHGGNRRASIDVTFAPQVAGNCAATLAIVSARTKEILHSVHLRGEHMQ
eukprot:m.1216981 g.1216981  ORF g.1216981 m.1216981 type:complete len:1802 (+) comp24616_c0_seq2:80-5485(+)